MNTTVYDKKALTNFMYKDIPEELLKINIYDLLCQPDISSELMDFLIHENEKTRFKHEQFPKFLNYMLTNKKHEQNWEQLILKYWNLLSEKHKIECLRFGTYNLSTDTCLLTFIEPEEYISLIKQGMLREEFKIPLHHMVHLQKSINTLNLEPFYPNMKFNSDNVCLFFKYPDVLDMVQSCSLKRTINNEIKWYIAKISSLPKRTIARMSQMFMVADSIDRILAYDFMFCEPEHLKTVENFYEQLEKDKIRYEQVIIQQ